MRIRPLREVLVLMLLPSLVSPGRGVRAQDAAGAEYGATASVRRDHRGEAVAVGDLRIPLEKLARVPRANAQGLLTLAPGVLLTNHGGEGHAAGMFLRGFDAGEGENLETLVEGVPLNEVSNHHGHGYTDTLFIAPELVRELRVVQGPFDPAQGDFAVAGTAEYSLGLPRPGLMVSAGFGRFRRQRLLVAYRPEEERKATFASAALERGDGFGIHRAYAQASAVGQYEAKPGKGTLLRTLLFASAQRWDSAGVIRADAYEARELPCPRRQDAQFFCTHDPNQGGSGQRAGISTVLERSGPGTALRAQAFVTVRGLRTKENFTGYTQDPSIEGPQRGDLRDGRTSAATLGARVSAQKSIELLGRPQDLTLGLYARHDRVETVMDRVRRELDVPYLTDFERNVQQTNIATYLRADLRPAARVRTMLGARADAFAYHVVDRNLPSEDRLGERLPRDVTDAYGFALSPKGALDLTVLDGVHWITSAAGGARSSDATALSESEAAPFARLWSAETGFSGTHRLGYLDLESRASAFFTHVSRDFVFEAESGRNQPVGASQRTGAMGSLRARMLAWFDVLASVSYARAHLVSDGTGLLALSGPRVPFVPAWLVRADAVVERALPWLPNVSAFSSLGLSYVGKRPLPQGQWAAPYTLVDLAAGARYRFVELSMSIRNLFDARYREAELHHVSNFDPEAPRSELPGRHFSAGAPRQWMFTLTLHAL